MDKAEKLEILEELTEKIGEAQELAAMLGRGYREDQINSTLTGSDGEFFGDGIPDWIKNLRESLEDEDGS